MEEWRDVPGFPGYQVSNIGRVRTYNKITSSARFSIRHWKSRILKQKMHHKDHYLRVDLWKDGAPHTVLVHRLVADAFIPTDDNGLTVNHIDGNKSNNCRENLEWVSLSDNIRHAFRTGLIRTQKPCVLIDLSGNKQAFNSQAEASRYLGRNNGYINTKIIRGGVIVSANGNQYTLA